MSGKAVASIASRQVFGKAAVRAYADRLLFLRTEDYKAAPVAHVQAAAGFLGGCHHYWPAPLFLFKPVLPKIYLFFNISFVKGMEETIVSLYRKVAEQKHWSALVAHVQASADFRGGCQCSMQHHFFHLVV